jgi:hypothetical protein
VHACYAIFHIIYLFQGFPRIITKFQGFSRYFVLKHFSRVFQKFYGSYEPGLAQYHALNRGRGEAMIGEWQGILPHPGYMQANLDTNKITIVTKGP